jgi:hypothetical protein
MLWRIWYDSRMQRAGRDTILHVAPVRRTAAVPVCPADLNPTHTVSVAFATPLQRGRLQMRFARIR